MIVRIHKIENGEIILVVCDKELIDKILEDGEKQLDLTSDFYKGEEMDEEEAGDLIRNSYMVHFVGKTAVGLGLREEIIDEENVKKISGVPYAQSVVPR